MDPKGGILFLLVIVSCMIPVDPLEVESNAMIREKARELMKKCQEKGYPKPDMDQLTSVFASSDVPAVERNSDRPTTVLSTFLSVLGSVSFTNQDKPLTLTGKTGSKTSNFTSFPRMIAQMRNVSGAPGCYMHALMAPMSWEALSNGGDNNTDSSDFEALLSEAKPMLLDNPPKRLRLPKTINEPNLRSMMNTLKDVYQRLSEEQKTEVMSWAKEQITQKYFNCTRTCDASLKWLTAPVLFMVGPYLSSLEANDIDSSPQQNLCEFFQSTKFKPIMDRIEKMNPSLAKKLLSKIQLCFTDVRVFVTNLDKLGPLACYYDNPPQLTSAMSITLLSQLSQCDNPGITALRKRLMMSATANTSVASVETIRKLGSGAKFLSAKQLSSVNGSEVVSLVKDPNMEWTTTQKRILMDKYLGEKKCRELSAQELKDLWPAAEGLPNCVFKKVKSNILDNVDVLKNMSKEMRKDQAIAMVQGLGKDLNFTNLVEKLPNGLLQAVPLNKLERENITSWDQVTKKTWRQGQAALLAKKMKTVVKQWYRNLGSVLQGITCEMMENVADSDVQEMSVYITDNLQCLSKVQAGCAAQKLFATLESQRADYFKTITWEELNNISTALLVHLPPPKVNDLPDSVCPVFLDKMEMANLSTLPQRSPSRAALTQRALRCLGKDLSALTSEDMYRLGPLLCEIQPSQLRLLNPDVLKTSLQAIALCKYIPRQHWAALVQLVNETFGNPSNWSADTMETMGPLLILDDNAVSALPKKPWMKDVISYLIQRSDNVSETLKSKLFNLTVDSASNGARKKRAANANSVVLTVELIRELGMQNVYWTAQQLDTISPATFKETVEVLGDVTNYNQDQLAVLSKKAIEAWGSVGQMNESVVAQLGCIAQGFSDKQLETTAFSLSSLEDIAPCGWNSSQMTPVWKAVAKHDSLSARLLEAPDLVALNRFICGLNSTEIQQLNTSAFTDAVASMDGIKCSLEVIQQFKVLTVSAFGDPSTWTEARVSDLGTFIAGLNASELSSLDASVFPFISKDCIPLIPPQNFAALSVDKLEALGPDNAAMVTSEQQAALSPEQWGAITRAITGSRAQNLDGGSSGTGTGTGSAPSLMIEGISAVTKPLLFLLFGLVLL